MDIFLDRRLTRDDNRGLSQGVTDNREIFSSFKLLIEPRRTVCENSFYKTKKKNSFIISSDC
jgi:alpha-mannosidase II